MAESATPLKTFVKDGKTRTAYTAADAVALRFDGWVEQTPAGTRPAAKPTAAAFGAKTNDKASEKADSGNSR